MTNATSRWLLVGLMLAVMAGRARAETWDFEDAAEGKLPQGWVAARSSEGPGSVWKIVQDKTAPAGALVLAQTAKGQNAQFNICVAEEPKLLDVDITVSLKATAGEIDQGGGLVWRYQNSNNYYLVRLNPLEGDFRLFHVVK